MGNSAGGVAFETLNRLPIWVGWRTELRRGKPFRPPVNVRTDQPAKSDDPRTWTLRDLADQWADGISVRDGGVGIMLGDIGDFCVVGIDFDTCRNKATGQVMPWVIGVLEHLGTYAEVSPSNGGLHALAIMHKADWLTAKRIMGQGGRKFTQGGGEHPPSIEIYLEGRYLTLTERRYGKENSLQLITSRDIRWLVEEVGPSLARPNGHDHHPDAGEWTRSQEILSIANHMKRGGQSFEEYCNALFNHKDLELRTWAETKGKRYGNRELKRAWDKVEASDEEWGDIDLALVLSINPDLPAPELTERHAPAAVMKLCRDIAYQKSMPVDFAAAAFINAVAGVIGSARSVNTPTQWTEPTILWFMVVGTSGTKKSPASDYFKSIVRELEQEVQQQAKDSGDLEEDEPPPRMLFINTTIEALMGVLARNPRGVWGCFDELGAWLNGFNQYKSSGGDRSDWLSLYNGGYHTTDRVKGGQTAIAWAGTSIIGNITPGAAFDAVSGSEGDGMAERFLYFYPRRLPAERLPDRISLHEVHRVRDEVKRAMRRLRGLKDASAHANADQNRVTVDFVSKTMSLTPEAWGRFQDIELRLRANADADDFLTRWSNKSAGRILRVAVVFKFLEWALSTAGNAPGRIDAETLEMAARFVCEYAEGMTRRVSRNLVLDNVTASAVKIVKEMKREEWPGGNLRRYIRRKVVKLNGDEEVDKIIQFLTEKNYVRRVETAAKSGRPRKHWEVNPQLFTLD